MDKPGEKDWEKKQREYEVKKARAKAFRLRLTCTICGEKSKLPCPCGTTQYCSVACQKIDWRERGHRKACKKIRDERAAEAARAEAPTPPREVFYGPAPRSHADEVRARIAEEHEAARLRREANPEREPLSARYGSCCPICREDWDVNQTPMLFTCCIQLVCNSCVNKTGTEVCSLCRTPGPTTAAEQLARVRRHVKNDEPEAIAFLGNAYRDGEIGVVKSMKKAKKLYKRAVELGNLQAMVSLGMVYEIGYGGAKMDKKKARQLFQMASDGGQATAHFNLAHCSSREGQAEEAFRLYKMAAEQGLTEAEFNVGLSFQTGVGVERDLDEARRWYARAAAKGDERAIESLARLAAA